MIYLSMVLIGRRHWQAREEGGVTARPLPRAGARPAGRRRAASPCSSRTATGCGPTSAPSSSARSRDETRELLDELRDNDDVKSVKIDAYISPQVPTEFAVDQAEPAQHARGVAGPGPRQDRRRPARDSQLRPRGRAGREELRHHAAGADRRPSAARRSTEEFFLGIAVTSGLDKVVTPFLNKGIPVEYELIRSIMTVAGTQAAARSASSRRACSIMAPTARARTSGRWSPSCASSTTSSASIPRSRSAATTTRCSPCSRRCSTPTRSTTWSTRSAPACRRRCSKIRSRTSTPSRVPGTGQPKQSSMGGMAHVRHAARRSPRATSDQLWRLLGVDDGRPDAKSSLAGLRPEQSVRPMQDPQWVFIDHGNQAPRAVQREEPRHRRA